MAERRNVIGALAQNNGERYLKHLVDTYDEYSTRQESNG